MARTHRYQENLMQQVMRSQVRGAAIWIGLLALVMATLACSLISGSTGDREATRVAIQVQQTVLSHDQAILTQAAMNALGGGLTPDAPATNPPPETQSPTDAADPLDGTPTPTVDPPIGELDERSLQSARILLFEDMSASGHIRLVKDALDQGDYFYLDVGSAKGWFKTQLASGQEWDLIIAAAEADRNFGGEYFQFIHERLEKGAAAIIEYRDLDSAPAGMSKPLLDDCGIEFQSDWFEPDLRVFYVLEPDDPIFNQPNRVLAFRNAAQMWKGDVGDLVEIKYGAGGPAGDARLLVGTNTAWKEDHGLLVNCLDGRLTLQLFASHEYRYEDIISLWSNYIYQALKNRFKVAPPPAPTPAITIAPTATPDPPPTEAPANPPVDPLGVYSCGGLLDARLTRPASYQVDLFEHHAYGTFMILRLEMINNSEYPIQVWDEDYALEGRVNDKPLSYPPDKPATGYLYIESGGKLYQDRIEPAVIWRTQLAFDIDIQGNDWELVIRPGAEFDEQVCEVRIPIP
jgi:hypothetical protein